MAIPKYDSSIPESALLSNWTSSQQHFAVAMLLARRKSSPNETLLVLAKRTNHLRTHSGQIGMPGGRMSATDQSPIDTAFRETFEELGIPQADLKFHDYLATTPTLHGGILVPCVSSTEVWIDDFQPNPDEVSEVVIAPWQLYAREHATSVKFNYFGIWRNSVHFQINHHRVWGLTAGILHRANLR